jgi:hypothetical protein
MSACQAALRARTTRRVRRLSLAVLGVGFPLLLTFLASTGNAQEVRVESNVQASPVNGGWYPWYELASGPTDPEHLIVCGSRWDVDHNAFYGFVYASSDGGRTWHTALEDKSSTWVTEQSCASGVDGKAYFLSEASKVVDGLPNHTLGTTRIFVSTDAGLSWKEAVRTGWADFSESVVDTQSGPNQNRLYSFFQDIDSISSDRSSDKGAGRFSRIGVIAFQDGETRVEAPISNSRMDLLHYRGAYPERVFLLTNGALLALYIAALPTEKGLDDTINAVRLSRDRLTLSDPVIVARAAITATRCYPSHLAAAYDASADTIYVGYMTPIGERCAFVLKTSTDGGRTWSAQRQIPELGARGSGIFSAAMAFNNAGVLGLIWRESPISDCWYFSASEDGGRNFTRARLLSQCSSKPVPSASNWNACLRMSATKRVINRPRPPLSLHDHHVLVLSVIDGRNTVWRNSGALMATADGVFHAVWIEKGRGEGQLRSAKVIVGESRERPFPSEQLRGKATRVVTRDVALLYGGDQHYDIQNGTLTVDIVLKNLTTAPLRAPLLLKALALSGENGPLAIVNASNRETGPGATWDISEALPGGILAPGATTKPYSLVFRLPEKPAPARETQVLSMRVEVLAHDGKAQLVR